MKAIFLMGCVFCLAGSQGWTMENTVDGHKRTGDQTLLTNQTPPVKKLKTEKGSPTTIISDSKNSEGIEEDTSRREDSAAEDLRQRILWDETHKAYCDMVWEVSGELKNWLNSEEELDEKTIQGTLEVFIKKYPTVFRYIKDSMSDIICKWGEGSPRGIRAQAIQDFLDPPCSSESSSLEEIEG